METAIVEVIESSKSFSDLYSLVALFLIGSFITIITGVYFYTKKAIGKSCEAEQARTAQRKAERDKELFEIKSEMNRINTISTGVGNSLDRHIEAHKDIDCRSQKLIDKIERLQNDFHVVDKNVVEIYTIIKERFK